MNIIQTHISYAKQRPVLTGVMSMLAIIMLGVGIGFATGVADPIAAKAVVILPPCCTTPTPPVVVPPPVIIPIPPVILPPCCTDTTPTPPVVLPPCCTTPTTPTPPVVLPPCCVTPTPPKTPPVTPPTTPVVVPPVIPPTTPLPVPQCIYLKADKTEIDSGEAVTLSWKTLNATSISIDNGVGAVTPVAIGTKVVHPTTATTYKATVNGTGGVVTCEVAVKLKTTPPPTPKTPACIYLKADKTTISSSGEAVTLSWKTQRVTSISIDHGVGSTTPASEGTVVVHPTETTTYTATTFPSTNNSNCIVTVTLQTGGGGGGGSGGGGGGSGGSGGGSGQVIQAPSASYVYLSQIPYTGLELGPVGTVIYWIFLSLWSIALAYLVLFKFIPFVGMKLHLFGTGVDQVLNHSAVGAATAASAHAAGVAHIAASHGHEPVVQTHVESHPAPVAATTNHSAGFSAFAPEGESLTIDDIVKGLSRESGASWQVGAFHQESAVPAHQPAPITAPPVMHAPAANRAPVAAPLSADVRDFTAALLNDERDVVFGTIRHIIREGGDAEAFLSQVVCAIDDAYRARVEGTNVHPEIAEITRGCATNFLERLVAALTNAVDSSYSVGVTGAKLALTRALAIVEG